MLATITAVDDDSYWISEDQYTFNPTSVLANDQTDYSNDPLAAVLVQGPEHGTLDLGSDGVFSYTPDANFFGEDTFQYRAVDGGIQSNVATATITVSSVNDLPVGVSDSYSVDEDQVLTVFAPGVLANDTDIENDPLEAYIILPPNSGSFDLALDGSFVLTPGPNHHGSDYFRYRTWDGISWSEVIDVSITINSVNDVPVAANDEYTLEEDGSLTVQPQGLLFNDSDVESMVSVSYFSAAEWGDVQVAADGSFTYVPEANFHGTDSFTYRITDGEAVSELAIVTLTVNSVNEAPEAEELDDRYRWAEDSEELILPLWEIFTDADDPPSELTFDLTTTGESVVSGYSINSSGELHVDLTTGIPGITTLIVRATDPDGAQVSTEFDLYSVAVTAITVERKTTSDTWQEVDLGEGLWDDDVLQWTAFMTPNVQASISSVEWILATRAPETYESGDWSTFASSSSLDPVQGNPGVGDWVASPKVMLPGGVAAYLAVPAEIPVARLVSIVWEPHDFGDTHVDFYPGGTSDYGAGDVIFPERPSAEFGTAVHDRIDVAVTVEWGAAPGKSARVFIKDFDPDHASGVNDFDTNGNSPNDNVGGSVAPPTELSAPFLDFTAGQATTKRATLTINGRQPGNNFIISGSGREDWLNAITFDSDGTTLLRGLNDAPVPANRQTTLLTVWRTLNIEEDSMAEPDVVFPGEFTDAGVGNDDLYPGDLGTGTGGGVGGIGPFVQPSLDLLASEFVKANIRVRTLTTEDDVTDNAPFVHNLDSLGYGNSVRDITSVADFWVVQVFAAYEWIADEDLDPILGMAESPQTGNTFVEVGESPTNIYLETIRDASLNYPGAKSAAVLRERVVLHEVIHRFRNREGEGEHDVGVMIAHTALTGTDEEIALQGVILFDMVRTIYP